MSYDRCISPVHIHTDTHTDVGGDGAVVRLAEASFVGYWTDVRILSALICCKVARNCCKWDNGIADTHIQAHIKHTLKRKKEKSNYLRL